MSITRQVQYSVLAVVACMITLSSFRTKVHGDIAPVVLIGQPAPGTANGRFSGFVGGASVNVSGDMSFMTMLDVGGVPSAGIFAIYGGVISPVALEGWPVPESSNLFFGGGLCCSQSTTTATSYLYPTLRPMQPGITSVGECFCTPVAPCTKLSTMGPQL